MKILSRIKAKYLYLKLCWNRANSHISIPSSIFERGMLIAVFLKVFNLDNYVLIGVIGGLFVLGLFVLGHLDILFKFADDETSLNNKYNPEMQKLLKK